MVAVFCSLEWKKSETEFVERKPKEKKPSGFVKEIKRKPDGTIVYMIPPRNQYILTVKADDGRYYTEDVYGIIKYYDENVRITKNFRIKFEQYMRTMEYSIDERGIMVGIYKTIRAFVLE